VKSLQQNEIHQFLEQFFLANNCEILINDPNYLQVQLTIEIDKLLMNRPFYWHYLEKTGGIPNPAIITLITNPKEAPEDVKGELIHFGSPRLHQIFQATKELSSYVRMYEKNLQLTKTALYPWLVLNIRVSYQCDLKKDVLYSIGLQLINGYMKENFHDEIAKVPLTPKIPDYSFTLSPIIMPKSGINRIYHYLESKIKEEDTTWAEQAMQRWQKDLDLLHHFFEDAEEEEQQLFELEKLALQKQYEPSIEMEITNGGIFYLSKTS